MANSYKMIGKHKGDLEAMRKKLGVTANTSYKNVRYFCCVIKKQRKAIRGFADCDYKVKIIGNKVYVKGQHDHACRPGNILIRNLVIHRLLCNLYFLNLFTIHIINGLAYHCH